MLNILIECFMNYRYKNVFAKFYHQVVQITDSWYQLIIHLC